MIVLATLALVAAGCNLSPLPPWGKHPTADVVVRGTASSASRALVQAATPENIEWVDVVISGPDRFGDPQPELARLQLDQENGEWSGTAEDLPAGPELTFTATAFDENANPLYAGSGDLGGHPAPFHHRTIGQARGEHGGVGGPGA